MSRNTTTRTEEWPYPGARWWRFDLHTHTPASQDTPWHQFIGTDHELTPEQWLFRFMQAEIDCVAITDHNSGKWIDRLKSAYAHMEQERPNGFRHLYLFPGVELSVNGGFHLLAIFNQDATSSDIDKLLGMVNYQGSKGECDDATHCSPIEVVRIVHSAGALAIPAHVDQSKGLLQLKENAAGDSRQTAMDPLTVKHLFGHDLIQAMEVVDRSIPKPSIYVNYPISWPEVVGSDCHNFRDQSTPGSRYTWIKMAKPSLEGLRLALMDGEGFSVRRSDDPEHFDPNALPEHFIESVEIAKARYMGRDEPERLSFSPWFNALIGGRGTGKSTVVHALRLAFRRDEDLKSLDEDTEPRRTFERFTRVAQGRDDDGALIQETHIILTLYRLGGQYRVHWRQNGSGVTVEEESDGLWQASDSQAVLHHRFPVRIFSQGQIAALAGGSQQALLDLIDEAAGTEDEKSQFEEAKRKYLSLRAKARELQNRLQGRESIKVRLEDVQRKLQKFEESHHAEALKSYQRRSRQEREISRQLETADGLVGRIRELSEELAAEDVPEQLFDAQNEQDREALAALDRLRQAIESAAKSLSVISDDFAFAVDRERQQLTGSLWQEAVSKARSDYNALVRELKNQGVDDPSEYGLLVQDRQKLENQWQELQVLDEQYRQTLEQAQDQLRFVKAARRSLSKRRENFLEKCLSGNEYVHISLTRYGQNSQEMERSFRELVGAHSKFETDILVEENGQPTKGILAELLTSRHASHVSPHEALEQKLDSIKERLKQACSGQGGFGGHFNNYLDRQYKNKAEFLDHLMAWYPDDGLEVRYSQKGNGRDFRPIEQASAGQRAAAMLAFLLAHGSEPIVLDQPEDDLDNHLIYNLVVQQLRANKVQRQIIAVTHNPNIVVNGDAEMVHALDFSGGQCRVVQKGSLQEQAMRDEVCQIMEGGRDAFERRYRRLRQES